MFGINAAAVAGGAGATKLHREHVIEGMRLWHFCLLSPDRERPLGRPRVSVERQLRRDGDTQEMGPAVAGPDD
jgi:hypothetical protein